MGSVVLKIKPLSKTARKNLEPIHIMYIPVNKIDRDKLWEMWKKSGWNQTRLGKEAGVVNNIAARFCKYRRVSLLAAGKIAIALAGRMVEKGNE